MISQLRKKVAGPKNRTKWEQYDLDFTYITDRIIAMAFPASGLEKTYRNSIDQVAHYLQEKHNKNYMVINVSNRQYDYEPFAKKVKDYPWNDHQAPTLDVLFQICHDVYCFLIGQYQKNQNKIKDNNENSANKLSSLSIKQSVVCFHCNHGKGRTGTAIISFLLFTGFFKDSEGARKFYNKKRFSEGTYGVDQPCQLRYLGYFQTILNNVRELKKEEKIIDEDLIKKKFPLKAYRLQKIIHQGFGEDFYLSLFLTRNQVSKHLNISIDSKSYCQREVYIKSGGPLIGDLYIEIWKKKWNGKKVITRANINLNFLDDYKTQTCKKEEIPQKKYFILNRNDVKVSSSFESPFKIELIFSQYCQCHIKPNKDCLCQYDRINQQRLWKDVFQKAEIGVNIVMSEALQILYIPYETLMLSEQQEKKKMAENKSQSIEKIDFQVQSL